MPDSRRFPAILALSLLLACGGEAAPRVAVERDSAGVHIVENTTPAWRKGAGWRVPDTALVEIGADADHPERDFARVVSAYRLTDGRLAVMDGENQQIRFFDSTGAWVRTAGGKGSGPGEFQSPFIFWRLEGDSLMVFDVSTRRISILSDTGGFVRAYMIRSPGSMQFPIPAMVLGDGELVAQIQVFDTSAKSGGAFRTPTAYVTYLQSGEVHDTLVTLPGREMYPSSMSFNGRSVAIPAPVPLGRNTYVAARGGRVFVGTNEAWEVKMLDSTGAVKLVARRLVEPHALTDEEIEQVRQETLERSRTFSNNAPVEMTRQIEDRIRNESYPEHLAFYGGMQVDAEGYLWVEAPRLSPRATRTYSILDSTGHWLGDVTMPDGFRPTDIGTDHVTGVWQDEDDLEYVRVYRLVRGS